MTAAFGVKLTTQPAGKPERVTWLIHSEPSLSGLVQVMALPKGIGASSLPAMAPTASTGRIGLRIDEDRLRDRREGRGLATPSVVCARMVSVRSVSELVVCRTAKVSSVARIAASLGPVMAKPPAIA